ncbi:MAG: hypothetical protein E7616_07950 [Ruminococcaceae bacterium]|nr:hypothetical protein [Oscillospiraceae bacterium]
MDENIYYDNYMDDNDSKDYDPFEEDPRYKRYYQVKKIVKFTLKTVIIMSVLAVIGALLFRIYTIQEPDMATEYVWNQTTLDAYNKKGENFTVMGQKMSTYIWTDPDTGESKTIERDSFNGGKEIGDETMRISNMYYTEAAKQVQVTFRWNQNAEKDLLDYYKLTELPSGELFYYVLTDEKGNAYGEVSYTKGSRYVYTYRRLLFENVDITKVNELYLNIYYTGQPEAAPFEQMIIYDVGIEPFEVTVEKPQKVTKGLTAQTRN